MNSSRITFTLLLVLFSIISFQCKKETPPEETPKEELIIGFWRTVEMRENSITQPMGAYATYEFREDSTVTYIQYDEGGDPDNQFDETWMIAETDDATQIEFAGEDPVDLITITETTMTVEYTSTDSFSGETIEHSDDYEKQ